MVINGTVRSHHGWLHAALLVCLEAYQALQPTATILALGIKLYLPSEVARIIGLLQGNLQEARIDQWPITEVISFPGHVLVYAQGTSRDLHWFCMEAFQQAHALRYLIRGVGNDYLEARPTHAARRASAPIPEAMVPSLQKIARSQPHEPCSVRARQACATAPSFKSRETFGQEGHPARLTGTPFGVIVAPPLLQPGAPGTAANPIGAVQTEQARFPEPGVPLDTASALLRDYLGAYRWCLTVPAVESCRQLAESYTAARSARADEAGARQLTREGHADAELAAQAVQDAQARIRSLQQELLTAEAAHKDAMRHEQDVQERLQSAHAAVAAATRTVLATEQRVEAQYAATRQLMEQTGALTQEEAHRTDSEPSAAAAPPPAREQKQAITKDTVANLAESLAEVLRGGGFSTCCAHV